MLEEKKYRKATFKASEGSPEPQQVAPPPLLEYSICITTSWKRVTFTPFSVFKSGPDMLIWQENELKYVGLLKKLHFKGEQTQRFFGFRRYYGVISPIFRGAALSTNNMYVYMFVMLCTFPRHHEKYHLQTHNRNATDAKVFHSLSWKLVLYFATHEHYIKKISNKVWRKMTMC